MTRLLLALALFLSCQVMMAAEEPAANPVAIGKQAPAFKIKDQSGKAIDLAELTAKSPVLVRLTCGCSGCDQELRYFQQINDAYKQHGLTSIFVFREPDEKVAKYATDKKLNMLYAVDTKGESWNVFQTKTMPSNFLIEKGGKIAAIATGCDVNGILANTVSKQAAKVVGAEAVDVKSKAEQTQSDKK